MYLFYIGKPDKKWVFSYIAIIPSYFRDMKKIVFFGAGKSATFLIDFSTPSGERGKLWVKKLKTSTNPLLMSVLIGHLLAIITLALEHLSKVLSSSY